MKTRPAILSRFNLFAAAVTFIVLASLVGGLVFVAGFLMYFFLIDGQLPVFLGMRDVFEGGALGAAILALPMLVTSVWVLRARRAGQAAWLRKSALVGGCLAGGAIFVITLGMSVSVTGMEAGFLSRGLFTVAIVGAGGGIGSLSGAIVLARWIRPRRGPGLDELFS